MPARPLRFADIDAIATRFPGVTVATKWQRRTWMIGDRGFAWERPLTKADLARFGDEAPPAGEILAVAVDGLDAKDALLALGIPGYFTIEHFRGYPAILIALEQASGTHVRAALRDAYRVASSAPAKRTRTAKPRTAKPRTAKPRTAKPRTAKPRTAKPA